MAKSAVRAGGQPLPDRARLKRGALNSRTQPIRAGSVSDGESSVAYTSGSDNDKVFSGPGEGGFSCCWTGSVRVAGSHPAAHRGDEVARRTLSYWNPVPCFLPG